MGRNVEFVISADDAKAIASFNKLLGKAKMVGGQMEASSAKSASRYQKTWSNAQEASFGDAAMRKVDTFGKWLITGSALFMGLRQLKQMFSDLNAEQDRLANKARETAPAFAQLVQLSGSVEEFQALRGKARQLSGGSAISEADAANVIFQLKSAGALRELPFFQGLEGISDIGELASTAALVRKNFGVQEAGSFREIISKGFAAAAPVTEVGVGDIMRGITEPAPLAGKLGLRDEEIFAAVSLIAERTGSGQTAGTQVRSLLDAIVKNKIPIEGGLQAALADIQGRGLETGELRKFLGRKEAFSGFLNLSGADFPGRLGEIEGGQAGDLSGQKIAIRSKDREARASLDVVASQNRLEQAQNELAIIRNESDLFMNNLIGGHFETGGTGQRQRLSADVTKKMFVTLRSVLGDRAAVDIISSMTGAHAERREFLRRNPRPDRERGPSRLRGLDEVGPFFDGPDGRGGGVDEGPGTFGEMGDDAGDILFRASGGGLGGDIRALTKEVSNLVGELQQEKGTAQPKQIAPVPGGAR